MAATARFLSGGVVTAGISTAYTAPAGTAVTITFLSLNTHNLSGTAGGPWSAYVLAGLTGAAAGATPVLLPLTAISARDGVAFRAPLTLPLTGVIVISASTASVFTYYIAGLEHN